MNIVVPEFRFDINHRISTLRCHGVTLTGGAVTLRPMTEGDWDILLEWNNDPVVMDLADHAAFTETTLEELQTIYRWISSHAHCFIIEVENKPIGECWLQRMNLQRIVREFPGQDLRRIDLMIGEKALWGHGYGTEAIGLLVDFGFAEEQVDAIFAVVAEENRRSRRAFAKNGFALHARFQEPDGMVITDLALWRADREAGLAPRR